MCSEFWCSCDHVLAVAVCPFSNCTVLVDPVWGNGGPTLSNKKWDVFLV